MKRLPQKPKTPVLNGNSNGGKLNKMNQSHIAIQVHENDTYVQITGQTRVNIAVHGNLYICYENIER